MKRREFIALVDAATACPLAARAQQPAMPVVGFLRQGPREAFTGVLAAFRKGLSETGFVEGRNLVIEFRWLDDPMIPTCCPMRRPIWSDAKSTLSQHQNAQGARSPPKH
jgi:hypothetical protein